jgi:hypothetical protein
MSRNRFLEKGLANLAPALRATPKQLRAAARKNIPGADESVFHDAIGYSESDSPFDRIYYVASQTKAYGVEETKNPVLAKRIRATWKHLNRWREFMQ